MITHAISKIVTSIETFQKQHPYVVVEARFNMLLTQAKNPEYYTLQRLGTQVPIVCITLGASALHKTCLPQFKDWLIFTADKSAGQCFEKHPDYKIATQSTLTQSTQLIKVVTRSEGLTQAQSFPVLAPYIQEMDALERSMASKKHELSTLKQLQELQEKDHRNAIKAWNVLVHKDIFEPCLRHAHSLKEWMEVYVTKANAGILAYAKEAPPYIKRVQFTPIEHAGIEEANRLKEMVCAIIPDIEKAIDWTQKEMNL